MTQNNVFHNSKTDKIVNGSTCKSVSVSQKASNGFFTTAHQLPFILRVNLLLIHDARCVYNVQITSPRLFYNSFSDTFTVICMYIVYNSMPNDEYNHVHSLKFTTNRSHSSDWSTIFKHSSTNCRNIGSCIASFNTLVGSSDLSMRSRMLRTWGLYNVSRTLWLYSADRWDTHFKIYNTTSRHRWFNCLPNNLSFSRGIVWSVGNE